MLSTDYSSLHVAFRAHSSDCHYLQEDEVEKEESLQHCKHVITQREEENINQENVLKECQDFLKRRMPLPGLNPPPADRCLVLRSSLDAF
jgi:hypothetical protein